MLRAGLMHDGLMEIRIEVCAHRLDRPDALLAQQIVELGVDQLNAPLIRPAVVGVNGARAIEIVDHEE